MLWLPRKELILWLKNAPTARATFANAQTDVGRGDTQQAIGEGDSICEISHELVLDNWQSVPHTIPQECPFRWQIIWQRRKAVRRR